MKLLFKYRPNDTLIHESIDNQNNLLLIMALENNFIIGAYSEFGFNEITKEINQGFLFSITKKEKYHVAERFKSKSICLYNEFFIIYGNSDIRFKIGEN